MSGAYRLIRPLLFALEPETAHTLSLRMLQTGLVLPGARIGGSAGVDLLGLRFPNRVGLAAGYDKNGEAVDALLRLGFGFVEVGTVTPLPQAGNPKPRLFRLSRDGAIINRLGFNSDGHAAVHARLSARRRSGIVGVNLGANRDSEDRVADYVAGVNLFADVADYLAINISSPNTAGLRELQKRDALANLLDRVTAARAAPTNSVPLLLKIAPDLDDDALATIAETALAAGIEGVIVSNATVSREGLADRRHADEAGGLSGRPLYARSTAMLTRLRELAGRRLTLVGLGGVDSAETALCKFEAGADLIQLYTGLIYEGPGLPARIVAALADRQQPSVSALPGDPD